MKGKVKRNAKTRESRVSDPSQRNISQSQEIYDQNESQLLAK